MSTISELNSQVRVSKCIVLLLFKVTLICFVLEVMGVLSEEQFTSGKCFQSTSSCSCNGTVAEKPSTASATLSHPVAGPIVPSLFLNGLLH